MKVSCLILTRDEEANIGCCLDALRWCDDIVVLDSGSTDRTLEIAREYGARILEKPFDCFANQRNFGLDNGKFRNDWVLHLDADEIVTPEFVAAVSSLEAQSEVDAYRVPSKTMLYGQWLKHAGMYPTYQVRLGHRDRLRFIQIGHGQREALSPDRLGTFTEPYLHYSFSHGMSQWLEKHLRYAADEADLILKERAAGPTTPMAPSGGDRTSGRRQLKAYSSRIPLALRPFARFVYVYVVRRGFLDGRAGFTYAFMLSVYEGMTALMANERLEGRP